MCSGALSNPRWNSIKLNGKTFNVAIIFVYAPTAQCTEEEIDNIYNSYDNSKTLSKSQVMTIIIVDLNTKLGKVRQRKNCR